MLPLHHDRMPWVGVEPTSPGLQPSTLPLSYQGSAWTWIRTRGGTATNGFWARRLSPLGYPCILPAGLEPASLGPGPSVFAATLREYGARGSRTLISCLQGRYPSIGRRSRVCPTGVEPAPTGLQPVMLPLHQGQDANRSVHP